MDSSVGWLFTQRAASLSEAEPFKQRTEAGDQHYQQGPPVMLGNQKLLVFWVWMLLLASLCPCALGKRGFGGKGIGKAAGKAPSQSKGSRQGLKLAGAAAAGALGGAAIGYGLGSMNRPRYGHGYGYDGYSDGYNQASRSNQSARWNTGTSKHTGSLLVTLGAVAQIIMWP